LSKKSKFLLAIVGYLGGLSVSTYNFQLIFVLLFSAPQEIDEYELIDPVDILTPLEKSGFWDGVVSSFLLICFSFEMC